MPAVHTACWATHDFACVMALVFGLGTRLHVRMCTKLENGALHNVQQPEYCEWFSIDQSEFGAVKMLSGRRALHCDKHQFRAKMTFEYLNHFQDIRGCWWPIG